MRDAAVLSYRGFMPEKFIEHALSAGIHIIEVKRVEDGEVLFFLTERNAEKLIKLAERYSLSVIWVKHSVRGETKRTALRRLSLIPALAIFVAMLALFASRVWIIEFSIDQGENLIAQADGQALLEALSELGVRPGAALSEIDADDLAMSLSKAVPDYAYISVRVNGVRLLVEAVHEVPAPEIYDPAASRDIIAGADGIITHIDVFAGAANVKVGDAVKRGQVLIRGEERLTDEVTRGVCALGEVRARCWVSAEAEGALLITQKNYTGEERLTSEIRLLDFAYPLIQAEPFEVEERIVRRLPLGGLYLPLSVVSTEHRAYEEVLVPGDIHEIRAKLALEAEEKAMDLLMEGSVMIDKWIDYSMIEGDKIRVRAVLEIERNIATTRSGHIAGGI